MKRYRDLQNIKNALEIYYITHKEFPEAQEMTNKMIKEQILLNIPKDPLHNQKTKNNEIFGYIYAIRNTEAGKNQAYIISAIFQGLNNEDSKLSALSNIDLPENFDFRDTKRANIILIE
ncbi:hypothetical protein A2483_04215 [Candidatus Peregrinibacteria bacterium RIFOXYC2_FULL_33_13]|nr:MAG: hypothetical protein A2483_04215 [Candidatus Peregrinibacteria bacterium RIFOXYC2_FULL_33_13]